MTVDGMYRRLQCPAMFMPREPKPLYFCTRLAGDTRGDVRFCPTCPLRNAADTVRNGQLAQSRAETWAGRGVEQK